MIGLVVVMLATGLEVPTPTPSPTPAPMIAAISKPVGASRVVRDIPINKPLGAGWYVAPVAGHGLDLWSTLRNLRMGAAETKSAVYGSHPSEGRLVLTKGSVCAAQLATIWLLDRSGQDGAAKTLSAISVVPGIAGGWNFAISIGK